MNSSNLFIVGSVKGGVSYYFFESSYALMRLIKHNGTGQFITQIKSPLHVTSISPLYLEAPPWYQSRAQCNFPDFSVTESASQGMSFLSCTALPPARIT